MYKLISFDVNGVLTPDLTMAKLSGLRGNYKIAEKILKLQTSGKKSLKEAFKELGNLTKGISLRQAIKYSLGMPLTKGVERLIRVLSNKEIIMVLNTTGYSITMHILNKRLEISNKIPFKLVACNNLIFSKDNELVKDPYLKNLITLYFKNPNSKIYDDIRSNGIVEFGINDESEKSIFIKKWSKLLKINLKNVVHVGDSMGDCHALKFIAENNGLGIAFNPNKALLEFIKKLQPSIRKNIVIIKNDLSLILDYIN